MTNEEDQTAGKTHMSWSWLRMALNLREKIKLGDKQVIFIWAALVGALGALTALLFEMGVELVQDLLTGRHGYRQIQAFQEMASQDWAWCIFVPAAGGLLAGLTLLFTQRFVPAKATEYMEAVALGNGYVPPKPSLLRSLSAVFSIGSGASIGREGPLVQSAAVVGSALGRFFHLSAPRLRLVVACAAASGMSAAFHTPLAGGLFVSEIVLGALTIDFLAPLLVASCAGYFTMGLFHEPAPIYQLQQEVSLTGNQHVLWCVLLGCLASLLASLWLPGPEEIPPIPERQKALAARAPDGRRHAGRRHRHLLPGNRRQREEHHHGSDPLRVRHDKGVHPAGPENLHRCHRLRRRYRGGGPDAQPDHRQRLRLPVQRGAHANGRAGGTRHCLFPGGHGRLLHHGGQRPYHVPGAGGGIHDGRPDDVPPHHRRSGFLRYGAADQGPVHVP